MIKNLFHKITINILQKPPSLYKFIIRYYKIEIQLYNWLKLIKNNYISK